MNWYYGPTDYRIIKTYDRNLEDMCAAQVGVFLDGSIATLLYLCMV
jgi:hypothetical protein